MKTKPQKKIRYGIIGVGHIAQIAVLPAFAHSKSSDLAALISGDATKLDKLSKKYKVPTYGYDELERAAKEQYLDAVYIALPNHMHCEYTVRAAKLGLHVICEKPLAMNERECRKMIDACEANGVQLMTAYRLHFNETHLKAVEAIRNGKIGEPRYFMSAFSFQIKDRTNIRLEEEYGGGTVYDLGIYCINAARYLFGDEPTEVFATSVEGTDRRFKEVDEMTAVTMKFPKGRLASFISSFGADAQANLCVVGSKGTVEIDKAYEYAEGLELTFMQDGKTKRVREHKKVDQFAAELEYFSERVATGRPVEPDGIEGLIDVRIIEAIHRSARTGRPVKLEAEPRKRRRPTLEQKKSFRPVREPELVHVRGASA